MICENWVEKKSRASRSLANSGGRWGRLPIYNLPEYKKCAATPEGIVERWIITVNYNSPMRGLRLLFDKDNILIDDCDCFRRGFGFQDSL
jgi:hypothetical protein